MAIRKVLTLGRYEKILRTKSEPVKKITRDIQQLMQDIKDTIEANPAVGLAAVQIGVLKRVFGARMEYGADQADEDLRPPTIFINPVILEKADEVEHEFDACLSIPNMMGYTNRSVRVKLRYMDELGETIEREFCGWDARVVLHEFDHLDGILFTDRLDSLDDLYVYVPDGEGKRKAVPYKDAVRRAESATANKS